MKFLLVAVNAKFIHSNPAVRSLEATAEKIPGKEAEVCEFTINQRTEDILSGIYEKQPDYIAFSSYIWNFSVIREILPELPKILPGIVTFLGGPEVSFHCEELLREFPEVSGIMTGEGEETFRELFRALPEKNTDFREEALSGIRGLFLRTCGFTGERPLLPMDSVPFFYTDESLSGENGLFRNRILYYESARGCPFRCSYCLSSIDKTVRKRSFEKVKEHLEVFLRNRVPQVKFIDRTFNADRDHALKIWTYLRDHDNGITNFHFEIAAELLTEEELRILSGMRPGAVQLEIGVQTANQETLSAIHRPADLEKIRSVVKRLLAPGNIHIHLDLIAGLPGEDYASFIHSFNEVFSMHPHELQLGFLKVLRGTEMEERAGEYGLSYLSRPPYEVLSSAWISYEELRKLKRVEEMLEIYWNSMQFTCTVPLLLREFSSPFTFFEALSDWYRDHDYFILVPARQRRYEIVLEFAEALRGEEFREKVREALTADYYMREKPKSRPSFVTRVPDLSGTDYAHRDPVTGNVRIGN